VKRLILFVVALSLLLATLTAGVRAYSQSRPEDSSAILYGFGLCEGSPCFLGIRPGVTTWEEAKKVVRTYYSNAYVDDGAIDIVFDADVISMGSAKGVVSEIRFTSNDMSLMLSAVLAKIGAPCAVAMYKSPCADSGCIEFVNFHYNSAVVSVEMPFAPTITKQERFYLGLMVKMIILSDSRNLLKPPKTCLDFNDWDYDTGIYTPWMGLASIRQRYLPYATAHPRVRRQ
jgi:hypothetical protein